MSNLKNSSHVLTFFPVFLRTVSSSWTIVNPQKFTFPPRTTDVSNLGSYVVSAYQTVVDLHYITIYYRNMHVNWRRNVYENSRLVQFSKIVGLVGGGLTFRTFSTTVVFGVKWRGESQYAIQTVRMSGPWVVVCEKSFVVKLGSSVGQIEEIFLVYNGSQEFYYYVVS